MDAVGAVVAAALALGVWLLAVAPLGRERDARVAAGQVWQSNQQAVAQRKSELEQVKRECGELRQAIEECLDRTPQAREWNDVVGRVVEAARGAGLELAKVQPESPERSTLIASAGLELGGVAPPQAVLQFLNSLAVELPSAEVRGVSLQSQGLDDQPCRFMLNLRIRLLSQRPVFAAAREAAP